MAVRFSFPVCLFTSLPNVIVFIEIFQDKKKHKVNKQIKGFMCSAWTTRLYKWLDLNNNGYRQWHRKWRFISSCILNNYVIRIYGVNTVCTVYTCIPYIRFFRGDLIFALHRKTFNWQTLYSVIFGNCKINFLNHKITKKKVNTHFLLFC